MRDGWDVVQIGDTCEVLDRLRKPITKRDRVAGPTPYYGATGILDYVEGFIFDEPLILVGEDGAKWGPGEKSAFAIAGKTWVNNHAHVLKPDRSRLLDDWLIYYLNHADLMPFISGLTVPKLNQGKLREIAVPLPPIAEQKRIVAILDDAFEAIERAEEATQAAIAPLTHLVERERDAHLRGCAGTADARLGDHIDLLAGPAFKSAGYTD